MLQTIVHFLLIALSFGLLLRLTGTFVPSFVVAMAVMLTLACRRELSATKSSVHPLLLGLIAALSLLYASRTGEFLSGNWDPGVYIAQGVAATHSSGWTIEDGAASLLSDEARYEIYPLDRGEFVKTPGFYAPFRKPGVLLPQFLPLYPTLLALANWLGGMGFLLRVDAILFALSLLLLADLAIRMAESRLAGFAFVALFGLHPAVIWFARFHTSESLALFLVSGLLVSAFAISAESRFREVFRAVLGAFLLPWTTPASWPLSLGVGTWWAWPGPNRRERAVVAAGSMLGLASVLLFLYFADHPYARHMLRLLPSVTTKHVLGLCAVALVGIGAGLGWAARFKSSGAIREIPLPQPARTFAPKSILIALLFGTLCLNLATFWILSRIPTGLAGLLALLPIAVWGWAAWGWFRLQKTTAASASLHTPLALITVAVASIAVIWPMMPEHYPWAWKRLIWLVFPVTAFYASVGIVQAALKLAHPRTATFALIVTMVVLPWRHHGILAVGGEWHGFHRWLRRVATEAIPPNAVVVTPKQLAVPLEFVFGHTVLPLYGGEAPRRDYFYRDLWARATQDRPVVVLDEQIPGWLRKKEARRVAVPEYQGYWIRQSRVPYGFQRQPRGYTAFIWTPRSCSGEHVSASGESL